MRRRRAAVGAGDAAGHVRDAAEQAEVVLRQFQETASIRGWTLLAAAVMANHAHLVVGVGGDPEPEGMLRSFKSYASRSLNARWAKPPNGTWWTESGSKRKLASEANVCAAAQYVRDQEFPLAMWLNTEVFPVIDDGERGVSTPW
jgi:REP element-mobilizing transposase RayT